MAVANSLSLENGARQIKGCINGLGEEQKIPLKKCMAVKTRPDHYGVETQINAKK